MESVVFVPSVPSIASVLVVGLFLWRVFVRMLVGMEARFNDQFKQVNDQFRQVNDQFRQVNDQFKEVGARFGQMESRFDTRFVSLESRFDSLEKKVDGLAADHHGLARELSEFRGEMRGRLAMVVPQASGEPP